MTSIAPADPQDLLQDSHNRTVFITRLPYDIDEATFRDMFQGLGTLETYKLFKKSRSGFVRFGTVVAARMAKEVMNGFVHNGSILCVKCCGMESMAANSAMGVADDAEGCGNEGGFAGLAAGSRQKSSCPPSSRLYIKRLPTNSTVESLTAMFGSFGTVVDARILYADEDQPDGDCGAIVSMSSVLEATTVTHLDGRSDLPGLAKPLFVRFANPPGSYWEQKTQSLVFGPVAVQSPSRGCLQVMEKCVGADVASACYDGTVWKGVGCCGCCRAARRQLRRTGSPSQRVDARLAKGGRESPARRVAKNTGAPRESRDQCGGSRR